MPRFVFHKIPENLSSRKWRFDKTHHWWWGVFDVVVVPLIVILVGIGAFGLGRLSVMEKGGEGVVLYADSSLRQIAPPTPAGPEFFGAVSPSTSPPSTGSGSTTHNFVASKSGSKYYAATCAGAKNINENNRVWFATASAAEAAGYAKAANCKF